MKLADKLVYLRKKQGLSQLKLAEMMNVSRQAISRWETGIAVPSAENLKYLGNLYNVSLDYLFNNDADELEIGDVLKGVYIQDEFTYEIIGILQDGSNIDLGGQEVSLNRYLLMPSFNIKEKPTNAEDDMFQVRHYANKLSGKLYYGTFNDFFKDYRKIRSINKEILQSEGEIIF